MDGSRLLLAECGQDVSCCSHERLFQKRREGVTNIVRQMSVAHQQPEGLLGGGQLRWQQPGGLQNQSHSTAPHKPSRWQPPADPATGRASAAQQQPNNTSEAGAARSRRTASGHSPEHSDPQRSWAQPAGLQQTPANTESTCCRAKNRRA